jgi:lysophospholipase L1-like esterase
MRILIFGDSIAYGAWDTEGGWAERLKREAHQQTVQTKGLIKVQVLNLSIGGDTSTKIVKRMASEIEARLSPNWSLLFVISFGVNDERFINSKPETSLKHFGENIEQIINIAKKYSNKIIFLGIPPVGQSIVIFKNYEYSDERAKLYDQLMQNIVDKSGLKFLPVRSEFEKVGIDKLYYYDNIHPNNNGHQLILDILNRELNRGYYNE